MDWKRADSIQDDESRILFICSFLILSSYEAVMCFYITVSHRCSYGVVMCCRRCLRGRFRIEALVALSCNHLFCNHNLLFSGAPYAVLWLSTMAPRYLLVDQPRCIKLYPLLKHMLSALSKKYIRKYYIYRVTCITYFHLS